MPKRIQMNDYFTFSELENSTGEIRIYGDIVDTKVWDDETSPATFQDCLNELGPIKTLNIRICSNGGSVFAGNAIIDIIYAYKNKTGVQVNSYIEGIAASMGSVVAMAADKIYMAENALLMLHKPFTVTAGNATDLQKTVEILQKTEDTIINSYMRHFNGTVDKLREMLADETWLTAKEALQYGLCDEITESINIAASAEGIKINGILFSKGEKSVPFNRIYNSSNKENFENSNEKNATSKHKDASLNIEIPSLTFSTTRSSPSTIRSIESDSSLDALNKSTRDSIEALKKRIEELQTCSISGYNPPFNGQESLDFKEEFATALDMNKNDITFKTVLNLAKRGQQFTTEIEEKAKSYDKIRNEQIESALQNGIRAKGPDFNVDRWRKILNQLPYEDIIGQSDEWTAEAKKVFHAGKRVSQPVDSVAPVADKKMNVDDFTFTYKS